MAELEIVTLDENGVSVKKFSELNADEKIALEVDVDLALAGFEKTQLLCVVCSVAIPSGLGHSYCVTHKPKFNVCELCNQEMRGLYCINCYTGKIITDENGNKFLEKKIK